jgi:hypothetical protein
VRIAACLRRIQHHERRPSLAAESLTSNAPLTGIEQRFVNAIFRGIVYLVEHPLEEMPPKEDTLDDIVLAFNGVIPDNDEEYDAIVRVVALSIVNKTGGTP